ncbi:hypothetical protein [Bacteroides faecis]|uniref:hypothetical protein n=1 Tax=Bacteroides faecis TaxID=674529 RepID=UPI0040401ED4
MKRDELKREMKELGMMRELTRKAYGCLLELSSQGEVASIWSESDLQLYRKKREKTCDVLKELRQFVHMQEQQERIDSVCLLLEQKEMLLSAAMSTFDEQESIGETVGEKSSGYRQAGAQATGKEYPRRCREGSSCRERSCRGRVSGEEEKFSEEGFQRKREKIRLQATTGTATGGREKDTATHDSKQRERRHSPSTAFAKPRGERKAEGTAEKTVGPDGQPAF